MNVFQLRELVTLTGAVEHIRQAWKRRLQARMASNDCVRVYELGGFLYEVHMDPRSGFIAMAIDVRQYAGLLELVRPKCCSSLDYAQALAAAKARVEGKNSPEFDDLEKASAVTDDEIRRRGGKIWCEIARLAKKRTEITGWVEGLVVKSEAGGEDETTK